MSGSAQDEQLSEDSFSSPGRKPVAPRRAQSSILPRSLSYRTESGCSPGEREEWHGVSASSELNRAFVLPDSTAAELHHGGPPKPIPASSFNSLPVDLESHGWAPIGWEETLRATSAAAVEPGGREERPHADTTAMLSSQLSVERQRRQEAEARVSELEEQLKTTLRAEDECRREAKANLAVVGGAAP